MYDPLGMKGSKSATTDRSGVFAAINSL